MIWDTAARLTEMACKFARDGGLKWDRTKSDHHPDAMLHIMQNAKLFYIPAAPHTFLPKDHTQDQCDFYHDNFFLPFRYTAIEDTASLILLHDTDEHARGLKANRQWLEFMPSGVSMDNYRDEDLGKIPAPTNDIWDRPTMMVTAGEIHEVVFREGEKTFIDGSIIDMFAIDIETGKIRLTMEKMSRHMPPDQFQLMCNAGLKNALQSIDEVAYFNDPSNFVLEEVSTRALKDRKRKKSKDAGRRVPRFHQRPQYTVLKPTQIRKRMHLLEPSVPGGMKRRPHERRAHLRTYANDSKRWPNVHGQTKVVKGSWVGPTESIVGNKRYKVLVNMRPPQLPEEVRS